MARKVLHGSDARNKLKAGVNVLGDAVRVTMGPRGRNVAIERGVGNHITKDGVTIAREIELEDPVENMGAQIVKEAATRTVDIAGDGTTTAIVLAQAIFNEGLRLVAAGSNPMEIRTGIEKGVAAVVEKLKGMAKEVSGKEDIQKIATISANGDSQVGETIAEIIDQVGEDGVVTVEEGHSFGLVERYVDGMQFDKGYISPYFVSRSEDLRAEIFNPYILITDKILSSNKDLMQILQAVTGEGKKDIVIIAEDVTAEALGTLILNYMKGNLNVVAVKAPAFGERRKAMLQDLAILTGGSLITDELGRALDSVTLTDLGTATKVVVTKDNTTIVDGGGEKADIEKRVESLKVEMEAANSDYDREKLQERIARMSGGVAVLEVGAATEVEVKELKDRVEDALSATRAAIEEGIVAGGGIALIDALEALDGVEVERDEEVGIKILRQALTEPYRRIMLNAGVAPDSYLHQVGKGKGYDARADKIVDMIKEGIMDPVKVTRSALENAGSVAAMLLTTETVVHEVKKDEEEMV